MELVDRSLRDGYLLIPDGEVAIYRAGLEQLANIRSGKKGSVMPRYMLRAGWQHSRTALARRGFGCRDARRWLEALRTGRVKDFRWLVE